MNALQRIVRAGPQFSYPIWHPAKCSVNLKAMHSILNFFLLIYVIELEIAVATKGTCNKQATTGSGTRIVGNRCGYRRDTGNN